MPTCFQTTSFSGTTTSRLQSALTCFITRCFSGTPQSKATTATALNFTYFTGGVPPSYSTKPHGCKSCGLLLVRFITAASFFQLRLLQALPSLGYKPRQIVFKPRHTQGTPTAKVTTVSALNATFVTGWVRNLVITILTFGTHVDMFYYLS